MRWLEISTDAAQGGSDLLCALLEALGVSGLVVEDGKDLEDFLENGRQYWDYIDEDFINRRRGMCCVKFYLPDDEDGRLELARLETALKNEGYAPIVSYIRDEDWENNWKRYYKPMEIGKKLLIVPEWEDAPQSGNRTVLRLNPGLIFGTGSHPSTRMCLEALEDRVIGASYVLDLGCGSGILALASLQLGADKAFGCDIDDKAPVTALANAALNGIDEKRFVVKAGNVLSDASLREQIGSIKWKLIFANIVADVVISLCPDISGWLDTDGVFICSGIIDGREDEVITAIEAAGLRVIEHRHTENWHCFTARTIESIQI
jgi:ribosomal protein L11 methyltransferase